MFYVSTNKRAEAEAASPHRLAAVRLGQRRRDAQIELVESEKFPLLIERARVSRQEEIRMIFLESYSSCPSLLREGTLWVVPSFPLLIERARVSR